MGTENAFAEAARESATIMAKHGVDLVYGGGRLGLMGLIADSVVAEAIQLRNDLRVVLNTRTTRGDARVQFVQLRQSWPGVRP